MSSMGNATHSGREGRLAYPGDSLTLEPIGVGSGYRRVGIWNELVDAGDVGIGSEGGLYSANGRFIKPRGQHQWHAAENNRQRICGVALGRSD